MNLNLKKALIGLTVVVLMNGCSHYESRVALGAVAGAATGALVADSTYDGYRGYGYGGYGSYHGSYYSGYRPYNPNYISGVHRGQYGFGGYTGVRGDVTGTVRGIKGGYPNAPYYRRGAR